jgi:hypothetical protein
LALKLELFPWLVWFSKAESVLRRIRNEDALPLQFWLKKGRFLRRLLLQGHFGC